LFGGVGTRDDCRQAGLRGQKSGGGTAATIQDANRRPGKKWSKREAKTAKKSKDYRSSGLEWTRGGGETQGAESEKKKKKKRKRTQTDSTENRGKDGWLNRRSGTFPKRSLGARAWTINNK